MTGPNVPAPAALTLSALIEALLFVADGPTPVPRLASALNVPPDAVETALDELVAGLASRGLRVQRMGDKIQLVTAADAAKAVEEFLGLQATTRLSPAALETLAIVAYKQPITRPTLEALRGVNCDAVLKTLLSRGLIEELGRAEGVGRPILYATTFSFLQQFGLDGLHDLPPLQLDELAAPSAELAPEPVGISQAAELTPEVLALPGTPARRVRLGAPSVSRLQAWRREVQRERFRQLRHARDRAVPEPPERLGSAEHVDLAPDPSGTINP